MIEGSRPSLVGTVLGRYVLERPLGEGGMGIVYAARHQDLGRHAAVKILHERYDASDDVRLRFLREGQAASRIRHPNIVDVYDVGAEAGRAYLVMELLEGENLRSLLARDGPLAVQRTADLLVPVVAALAAAHDRGVVHRDLKPDNIFLATGRNTLQPKLLDFGISKLADHETGASLTGTGALLGTPYYMSPEQARTEKNIDARSDQYSVGVILYECVTGRRPIEEPALYQQIQRIVHGDFSPPRQVDAKIPVAFERLILRAMARDPAERFPSTRALGRDLLAFSSERVRAYYVEELAHQELRAAQTPAALETDRAFQIGTTLRESVHERVSSRTPVRARGPAARVVAPLALLVGLTATLVWQFSKRTRPEPELTAAANSPMLSSAPEIATQRDPAPQSVPEASTKKAPSADLPAASASIVGPSVGAGPWPHQALGGASAEVTSKRPRPRSDPKSSVSKRVARPADRPELAPR